jgi:hypothetical protein
MPSRASRQKRQSVARARDSALCVGSHRRPLLLRPESDLMPPPRGDPAEHGEGTSDRQGTLTILIAHNISGDRVSARRRLCRRSR